MTSLFHRSAWLHGLGAAACMTMLATPASAQWTAQNSGTDASFRGMSVVDASFVWISGTRGTFAWTDDAGRTWHAGHVAGAESRDFRAVNAITRDTAVLEVASPDTALIYRTTDRGVTWKEVHRDESKGAFLDALAFFDSHHGLAIGDPVAGHFVLLETVDGGETWKPLATTSLPLALAGEGAFAASGTALITCGSRDAWFATGGASVSRVFHTADAGRSWTVAETPIKAGSAPAGIFSLACRNTRELIAVGGNYAKPHAADVTVALSSDGGATWKAVAPSAATPFMSGVAYLEAARSARRIIAVGTEGTAYSTDSGNTWTRLDSRSLNVVHPDGRGSAWGAGARGSVTRLGSLVPM